MTVLGRGGFVSSRGSEVVQVCGFRGEVFFFGSDEDLAVPGSGQGFSLGVFAGDEGERRVRVCEKERERRDICGVGICGSSL